MSSDLSERLAHLLGVRIDGLQRLSGGASRETWAFDAIGPDGRRDELILRRDPAGAPRQGVLEVEAHLFRAAARAGVPVPNLRANGPADPDVLGTAFLVMERVAGETIARKILRDEPYATARRQLAGQLGAAAARVHTIDPGDVPGLVVEDPVEKYRNLLDELGPSHPAFELGLRWLERNRPPSVRRTVVHGDFRLGNVIVDQHGLASVLDWELAHIGDPLEDLGYLCIRAWRFGGRGPVAGVGSYAELADGYESASGERIDLEALRWWEAVGTLKWGVICVQQASVHLTGAIRSVELAAIGRRVCEQEFDLMEMLP